MSLINDMLRELDRRRAGSGETSPLVSVTPSRPLPSRGVILLILVMAIALVGVLLIVAYLLGRGEPARRPVVREPVTRVPVAVTIPGERVAGMPSVPASRRDGRTVAPSRPVLLAVVPSPRGVGTAGLWLSFSASLASVSPVRDVRSLRLRLPARLPEHLPKPSPPAGFASLRFEKTPGGMILLARAQAGFRLQLSRVPGAEPSNSILALRARPVVRIPAATVRRSSGSERNGGRKISRLPRVRPRSAAPVAGLVTGGRSEIRSEEHRGTPTPAHRAAAGGGSVSVLPQPVPAAIRARKAYNRGVQDLAAGHASRGRAALRRALAIDPRLVPARLLLAGIEAKAGRIQASFSLLDSGLALGPDRSGRLSLVRLKARILVAAGRIDRAIDLLEKNAPAVNDDPDYHALLAGLEVRAGNYRRAARQYAALLPLAPDRATWWLGLAIALDQSGRSRAARKAYRSALEHPGLNPAAAAYARHRLEALQGEKG